ncbi:type I DNA topoisomerase [Armatimonas sp.]|uniref:type I DNA topoisomerase n=1 Tax=Armatimonas sp. TaxID=1872638 RepID=UPI00286A678C|nr:type I DNA topoisomerase [Armatimonas sp.]
MARSLIIVESPAKTKTIKGFLGPDYKVEASMGHVRDLPKSKLSVDIENDFALTYEPLTDRKDVLGKLAAAAKGCDTIYLASDPDREGEAISWHIATALKLPKSKIKRIVFNEITKAAVNAALANPREINQDKVEAQETRRTLDRLVGYKISPLLWKKVRKDLSAGRVQSVAVRLICDREREILAFVPVEYWSLTANLAPQTGKKQSFDANLAGFEGKKLEIKTEDETMAVLRAVEKAPWTVAKVKKSERQRRAYAPFITSTIQQEAARKLGFSSKRTMTVAQQLYEGIDLGGDAGTVGLITYMRTDSTRVAGEAQVAAKEYIVANFGKPYAPEKFNVYKSKNAAQDAHEAIRPTYISREPDSIKTRLNADQYKLYRLIWLRFIASQMSPAVMDVVQADIEAAKYTFRATGSTIKFDGFLRVYTEGKDNPAQVDDDEKPPLPPLNEGMPLDLLKLLPKQHFTEPPPRFTEATLVKTMEEQGIGRPSTYASIISTIQDRGYVALNEKKFQPTDLGNVVTDLLVQAFPQILDVHFTAGMEERLDAIEEGTDTRLALLKEFYEPFAIALKAADENMGKFAKDIGRACPECGKALVEKFSRYGKFISCSGYPDCKYSEKLAAEGADGEAAPVAEPVVSEIPCPNCGRLLVEKTGRFGKFLACPGYPECKYIHKDKPAAESTGVKCFACGKGEFVEKRSRSGVFYSCNQYPACKTALPGKPLTDRKCPQCEGLLHEKVFKGRLTGIACANKACGYSESIKAAPKEEPAEA